MPLQIGKSTNTSPDNDKQNDQNGEDHTNFWTAAAFFCLRCKSTGLIPLHRWCICESRLLIVVHSWWLGIAASLKPTCRKWRRRLRVKRLLGCRGSVSVEIVRIGLLTWGAKNSIVARWIGIWWPKCLLWNGKTVQCIIWRRLGWRLSPWLSSRLICARWSATPRYTRRRLRWSIIWLRRSIDQTTVATIYFIRGKRPTTTLTELRRSAAIGWIDRGHSENPPTVLGDTSW